MSLHKGYFDKCPKCGRKGVHMTEYGYSRCKYCFINIHYEKDKDGKVKAFIGSM